MASVHNDPATGPYSALAGGSGRTSQHVVPGTLRRGTQKLWRGARAASLCQFVAVMAVAVSLATMARGDAGAVPSAITAIIVFCAATLSSVVGFAFSPLALAPLAQLSIPAVQMVEILLVGSIAIQGYSVWVMRRSVRWRRIRRFIAFGAMTAPLGVWTLLHFSSRAYVLTLGLFLAAYGIAMLARPLATPRRKRSAKGDAVVGALGGLTAGIAAFPGAFITPWCGMQGWNKERQRATYQPYILSMQLLTLFILRCAAPGTPFTGEFLVYAPVAMAGAHFGIAMFRRLTTPQFTMCANLFLVVSGVALLARAL